MSERGPKKTRAESGVRPSFVMGGGGEGGGVWQQRGRTSVLFITGDKCPQRSLELGTWRRPDAGPL